MVNENSDAYKKGLRNGNVITKKDGRELSDILDNDYFINATSIAVKENERINNATLLFLSGNDSIDITFINDDNEEITINVNSEEERQISASYLLSSKEYDNLSTKMLTDDIGYINITTENYDSFVDLISVLFDDFSKTTKVITEKLDDLSKQGMKKLVVDLRNNYGGTAGNAASFVSPFFDNNFKYAYDDYGEYYEVIGTGKYSSIPMVVLVSDITGSAGDIVTSLLQRKDNATIMGFMEPSCSAQYAGGSIYLTHGLYFGFPGGRSYDMNGNALIDTKKDGIATIKLDVKIPITKENITDILNYNGDYALDYAINYLK